MTTWSGREQTKSQEEMAREREENAHLLGLGFAIVDFQIVDGKWKKVWEFGKTIEELWISQEAKK